MKCYIATYYKNNNYGTKLQNYALSCALREMNIEPITISIFCLKDDIKNNVKKLISFLPGISDKIKYYKNIRKKAKSFKKFNKLIKYKKLTYNQLYKINFKDAFALSGSDQIWLPTHLKNNIRDSELFFLNFAPQSKRFSYAPSFGVEEIPKEMKEFYKKNLKEINKISVRETSGKRLIKELVDVDAVVLPDPVFLLDKNEWNKKIADNKKNNSEEYIVTYFLGTQNKEVLEKINKYANKNNYKIYSIAGNYINKNSIIPSPIEFLKLIKNAKVVFTDSFHAVAFSIIMQTKFVVFNRKDVKQFSRLETLLNKYDLTSVIYDESMPLNIIIEKCIFDEKIKIRLQKEQMNGKKYLEAIIANAIKKGD